VGVANGMLTLAELQASTINADVAREAYIQADRHLSDLLDVKKSFEQKATTLLGAYITLSIALFGFGGAVFKESGLGPKVWPFFGAGAAFIIGAWFFSRHSRQAATQQSEALRKCG
jgi:hypothetical protein